MRKEKKLWNPTFLFLSFTSSTVFYKLLLYNLGQSRMYWFVPGILSVHEEFHSCFSWAIGWLKFCFILYHNIQKICLTHINIIIICKSCNFKNPFDTIVKNTRFRWRETVFSSVEAKGLETYSNHKVTSCSGKEILLWVVSTGSWTISTVRKQIYRCIKRIVSTDVSSCAWLSDFSSSVSFGFWFFSGWNYVF